MDSINKLLENLNKEQKEAVLSTEGPNLIVAGAGSGKTRVLTTRLAHIINTKKAWANQILCVTFTNKAAKEMQNRVLKYVSEKSTATILDKFNIKYKTTYDKDSQLETTNVE